MNTLTELSGRISVIHASLLIHLFDEEKQFELARRLATLLDDRSGSMIFGFHGGMPVKGQRNGLFPEMFFHSPESWTKILEGEIFERGQVKATAVLVEMNMPVERLGLGTGPPEGAKFYWLVWSVERL